MDFARFSEHPDYGHAGTPQGLAGSMLPQPMTLRGTHPAQPFARSMQPAPPLLSRFEGARCTLA